MRRLLLVSALVALALPSGSAAARPATEDGTLSVRNGEGTLRLMELRGALIGRIGNGVLEVEEPKGDDCEALAVWGAEIERRRSKQRDSGVPATVCVFKGTAIRFRLLGGLAAVFLKGKDIDLSVVGHGALILKGAGLADGSYSLNGAEYASLPDDSRWLLLGTGVAAPGER